MDRDDWAETRGKEKKKTLKEEKLMAARMDAYLYTYWSESN